MKDLCAIVRDLLPLYVDDACSRESKDFVEKHVAGCEECSSVLERLRSAGPEDSIIAQEDDLIERSLRRSRRRSTIAGAVVALILMVPVVVCLIVNIAVGHSLDWFFIVLSSLLVVASVTALPMLLAEKRFLCSSCAFLAALLILLATCCIYTKGRWFFIAAFSVLLGFATTVLPVIACQWFPEGFWKHNKGLLVFCSDTVLLVLLLASVAVFLHDAQFLSRSLAIAGFSILPVWGMFLSIRYLKIQPLCRAGVAVFFLGSAVMFINPVVYRILGEPVTSLFERENRINAYVALAMFAAGVLLVLAGIVAALVKNRKRSRP